MKVIFYQKNIKLSEEQKDYITDKIESLQKFRIMEEPSVVAKVDLEYMEGVASDRKYQYAVNVTIPGQILRAEVEAVAVEEGIDLIEEKLRHQLEKYKTEHE